MKIFILDCTENELRANRGIMDAIVDACRGLIGSLYGTYVPGQSSDTSEDEEEVEE